MPNDHLALLRGRPLLVALAGPNGAGKTTFYHTVCEPFGLPLINADVIAAKLAIDSYKAAQVAADLRRDKIRMRESFVFETVFSDPVGDKLSFLKDAAEDGYTVLLCFIGISSPSVSEERVTLRVAKGGHDVPTEKIISRYPRILANLQRAKRDLPYVWVYDNDELEDPYRLVAIYENGKCARLNEPVPDWLKQM